MHLFASHVKQFWPKVFESFLHPGIAKIIFPVSALNYPYYHTMSIRRKTKQTTFLFDCFMFLINNRIYNVISFLQFLILFPEIYLKVALKYKMSMKY
jgi:hypothetical protein